MLFLHHLGSTTGSLEEIISSEIVEGWITAGSSAALLILLSVSLATSRPPVTIPGEF